MRILRSHSEEVKRAGGVLKRRSPRQMPGPPGAPTKEVTASQKVHLRRCASSFVIAAYFYVRLIPQDSRALHLELFAVPSTLAIFYQVIKEVKPRPRR
jgi:hypothetical protein